MEHHANYYSPKGELLDFGEAAFPPKSDAEIILPDNLETMISLAEKLSHGIPFLRVDFYNIQGLIYFGELTFYPGSGFGRWTRPDIDLRLGDLISLS